MSKWVCDLLVTHCIMNHPRYEETGKLNPAKVMRRILQLLAAGIFLPNSVGLSDPTENGKRHHLIHKTEIVIKDMLSIRTGLQQIWIKYV